MKKLVLAVMVVAFVGASLGLVMAGEHPTSEHPVANVAKPEHPTAAGEAVLACGGCGSKECVACVAKKAEHPTSENSTSEHPAANVAKSEHPTAAGEAVLACGGCGSKECVACAAKKAERPISSEHPTSEHPTS